MPDVEKSPFSNVPNEMLRDLSARRSMTPAAGAPAARDPNPMLRDGDPGGSGPLARSASPVSVPDHRFNIGQAKMPQPASVTEPGTGAIPIYGYKADGMPNRAMTQRDSVKK